MSQEHQFRLGDLLGAGARCSFLSEDELMALVEGRLSATRRESFDAHVPGCADCTELLGDLEQYRVLTSAGVTVPGELRSFQRFDARTRRQVGLKRGARGLLNWRWWVLPAALAALVLALVTLQPGSVLIEAIEPIAFLPPPAVRGSSAQAWREAQGAWQAGDMTAAAEVLAAAAAEHPTDDGLLFYAGVAQLRSGRFDRAVASLRAADELQQETPSELTRWMLATALDRQGSDDAACAMLRSVVELGGARAESARAIVVESCR